ncbi:MAG: hypothetical protein U0821_18550 [Chloroflexota bacterium]
MPSDSARAVREQRAVESFRLASEAIGQITPGMAVFALTRGQWSMVDALLACIQRCAPASISVWTWTIASYEVDSLARLHRDAVQDARLVIDGGARNKNAAIIRGWQARYGTDSVRYVRNHAKLARVEGNGLRLLLRGSMNLNHNPRLEQFDLSEGGPAYDLVRRAEEALPSLPNDATDADVYAATGVSRAWTQGDLAPFAGVKVWAK